MKIVLVRERARCNDHETFGTMSFPEVAGAPSFKTVEQPWRQNAIGRSCIPTGTYKVYPHVSPTKGECYIIENEALNIYRFNTPRVQGERALVLIHKANVADQLLGCIAPGTTFGRIKHLGVEKNAVLNSGVAFEAIKKLLGRTATHTLTINYDKELT